MAVEEAKEAAMATVHDKVACINNEIIFSIIYKRERDRAPVGLASLLVRTSFGGRFDLPVPMATHWLVGQEE